MGSHDLHDMSALIGIVSLYTWVHISSDKSSLPMLNDAVFHSV